MPIPEIDALSNISDDNQIKAAVSSCIATEINNGKPRDQAVAACYSMVSKKTGKQFGNIPTTPTATTTQKPAQVGGV
jgi:hypothetical protein